MKNISKVRGYVEKNFESNFKSKYKFSWNFKFQNKSNKVEKNILKVKYVGKNF